MFEGSCVDVTSFEYASTDMLQNSMFSAFSYECFLKKSTMASYAPFNSSHNSFSYSSGLEFNQYRPPVTTNNNVSNSDTTAEMESQQHSKINGAQNILTNGNMVRSSEKLYGSTRENANGLSTTIDSNTRGTAFQNISQLIVIHY